jgi:[ribosomal protein S18]-alanine N-acetyltransferase
MVARPPVRVVVELMTVDDLPEVQVIERESFTTPWPPHAYRQELENNRLAQYIVARCGDTIVGFAGIWLLVDEAHVTTFATRRSWRRLGIGDRLILALLDLARTRGAHEATLEVRPSNLPARRLYEKYGFKVVGVRLRYYSDDNEDALIMTTESLDGRHMRDRIAQLRAELSVRPDIELGPDGLPVRPPATGDDPGDQGSGGGASGGPDEPAATEPREPRVIRPSSVMRRTR